MTDWKALCQELVDELHSYKLAHPQHDDFLVERARAALAQPEPEELTGGKLEELADDYMVMDGSNGTMHLEHLDFARAAIAADRAFCARPAIKPVPVSERLPKPEDCDAEGRCWWLKQAANPEHDLLTPTWHLQRLGPAGSKFFKYTHWLPHWALPVPTKAS